MEKFTALVKEDGDVEEGGYSLGEWRHVIEVLYWCLKDNPGGVAIAREFGLAQLLLQISACELPFAEYKLEEPEEEGDGGERGGSDVEAAADKKNGRPQHEDADFNIEVVDYYALPANHHTDPLIDGESVHYYYCSSCRVPEPCKRQLRGRFKEVRSEATS